MASKPAPTSIPLSSRQKANGLEPYQYLRQIFTALPQAETVEDIENLLPRALKKPPADA